MLLSHFEPKIALANYGVVTRRRLPVFMYLLNFKYALSMPEPRKTAKCIRNINKTPKYAYFIVNLSNIGLLAKISVIKTGFLRRIM
jgi:hypothetical protein